MTEPKAMRTVHEIQEKIYEEQKKMSDNKKLESLHTEAEEAKRKLGLRLRTLAPFPLRKTA